MRRSPIPSDPGPSPPWHALGASEVAERLGTDPAAGLAPGEAARRLAAAGPNLLPTAEARAGWRILLAQFGNVMVLVLAGAAILAALAGEAADAGAIVAILVLNALLGFLQEHRAERALAALRVLAEPRARARRGGAVQVIPAAELVPGDLVLLDAGAAVPADLRLVVAEALRTHESALTGESVPVDKDVRALADEAPLAERTSLAFRGTTVVHGRGEGIVVATGTGTELGRIAADLARVRPPPTPLEVRLAATARRLAVAALGLAALVVALGALQGRPLVPSLLTALSLAVAAIPEALPAVVAVSLALGARRMARHQALVRRLAAAEALGTVTVICTDKTGTLTENRLVVERVWLAGHVGEAASAGLRASAPWPDLVRALVLCNDATPGDAGADPVDRALLALAVAHGADVTALRAAHPRVAERPFAAERQRMTTLHGADEGLLACSKGAAERIVAQCATIAMPEGDRPIAPGDILDAAHALADAGHRVLAVAVRHLPVAEADDLDAAERGQRFLGLVALADPPRPAAREALATTAAAGIRGVMLTGDHPLTARAVARELGMLRDGDLVLTGPELDAMAPDARATALPRLRVVARSTPAQKLALVEAFQARGEVVAMTGDGVNDAPALRRADVGVAMGRAGTDVAREAAGLVLLDDDFATIVRAVREGRRVYDNIRRFVRYVLAGNLGEIIAVVVAPLAGLPIPLLPVQILWVNLVTDGLPGLALAAEHAEPDVMARAPRPRAESLFAHGLWQHVTWVGLLIGGLTLGVAAWGVTRAVPGWRTMAFSVLALAQLWHALAIRAERASAFDRRLRRNPWLLATLVGTAALQYAAVLPGPLQALLRLEPIGAGAFAACLALSAVVLPAVELEKWLVRRGRLYREG